MNKILIIWSKNYMDDFFEPDEKLYRAVRPCSIYYKEDGSLSSAAFKSSNGCSVDRGNGRSDKEAVQFILSNLTGDVYSISVDYCISKNIFVHYEPIEDKNPYHCGLYKNNECIFRGGGATCPAWREPRVRTRRSHPFGTNVIQRLLSHRPLASTCRVLHQWP
ncbi:hypothetical protein B0O40_0681 [Ruminococcaceae bacterium R-25]|nr:hypothetical protein B0O40_0681 [Ruminococcaceae bacterium R-25]SUQ11310.1 hypothetical protein SAMN06297423_0681 [Oscillospiraceae bacterium]